MNHCVPDFEMDEDGSIPASSGLRKSPMSEDGNLMELLWHNGQVVMQSQNQTSLRKSSPPSKFQIGDTEQSREIRSLSAAATPLEVSASHLFMQEDEMASWLHYSLDDSSLGREFCVDLLYPPPAPLPRPPPCVTNTTTPLVRATPVIESKPLMAATRPPMPPLRKTVVDSSFRNFGHFSRVERMADIKSSDSIKAAVKESTVVDSSDTPLIMASKVGRTTTADVWSRGCGSTSGDAGAGTSSGGGGEPMTSCDMTVSSSPGGSGASASASGELTAQKLPAEDRKRKAPESDETEWQSEDVDFESVDAKKQLRGSSTKRTRAAEVHNLSERRRRDRINEKMKALQELIPRCNKSDKASMLDEAIEYLKSLQLQVQMMSMGCSMVPMMFSGVQQYMSPMGMGMSMGMGMNRPMLPFHSVLSGSSLPAQAAAAHLGPRFPMPAFHMPQVPAPSPSRIQVPHQSNPMLNSLVMQNPSQAQTSNFADPYQQYLGLHQMQFPLYQNQATAQPSTSKPSSSSRGTENPKNDQSG